MKQGVATGCLCAVVQLVFDFIVREICMVEIGYSDREGQERGREGGGRRRRSRRRRRRKSRRNSSSGRAVVVTE